MHYFLSGAERLKVTTFVQFLVGGGEGVVGGEG